MLSSGQTVALLNLGRSAADDAAALISAGRSLSFRDLDSQSDRLAARLGAGPGERVALVAPNVPALVVALVATWKIGAVAVPLSGRLRSFELERAFFDAQPTTAVSLNRYAGFHFGREIAALAARTVTLARCIVTDPLGNVIDETRSPAQAAEPVAEDVAAILYTSGTTGEPKGAMMSHRLVQAQTERLTCLLGEDAAEPCMLPVPFAHAFGFGCGLASLAAHGALVLVDVTSSLQPLLDAARRSRPRVLHGSPVLFGRLQGALADAPLRRGFTAGSSCPPELIEHFDRRGLRLLNLYGMSEIGAAASCTSEDPPEVRYRTVGRALEGFELRTAPSPDANVDLGEIQVRGNQITPGYFHRPWTDEETAGDGWFRTGDLGSIDAAGNLTIAGRAKDVVHVGGFNVFPAEVESYLLTHPKIAHAAVIGAPHPVMGEALQAFVVPDQGAHLNPSDVVQFARAGVAGYKVPYRVEILDELPTLASGKPDRRQLARPAHTSEVAY